MKRLFISVLIIIYSVSIAGAYYESNSFTLKKNKYKVMMQKKVVGKIKRMSLKSQEKLLDIINKKITQLEKSTSMSEQKKMQRLSMFSALRDILKDVLLSRPVVNVPGETV